MSFAPTTPSHALPGAFLHTPAVASRFNSQQEQDPVRRRLFGEQPTQAANPNPQTGRFAQNPNTFFGFDAPTDDQVMRAPPNPLANSLANPLANPLSNPHIPPQSPLAKAANFINSSLNKDESYPEIDLYCRRQCPFPPASQV